MFRWTLARGFEDLGAPSGARRDGYLAADAVSADGSVIVGDYESKSGSRGYRWSQSRGFQEFSGVEPKAYDVSGDGSQIVGSVFDLKEHERRAARWVGDSPPQPVGPPELRALHAGNISADGRTIAGSALVGKADERGYVLRLK